MSVLLSPTMSRIDIPATLTPSASDELLETARAAGHNE
jgi:hypothetical protein